MREPREPTSSDSYQRPQQGWRCGLITDGASCPVGPTPHGACPAATACRPVRDGDRWHCNRSPLRGGPCDEGPRHDGTCAIVYRCAPIRSLRMRRGRFVVGAALAALGAACLGLSGWWRNELIVPGPLSAQHAQILNGQEATLRCAQCHVAGDATAAVWWAHSFGDAPLSPAQSALCMECHEESIEREWVLAAHNVELSKLEKRAGSEGPSAPWDQRRRDPRAAIACSACHREHQGRHEPLTAIDDTACQACHRQRYDSFAGDHPEFDNWPYERRTRIAFDHAAHELKHFPEEKRAFSCALCHQSDPTGQRQLTADYAASCAVCHDKPIDASLEGGVSLLAIPTIDVDALTEHGHEAGAWPAAATGDFEGALPAAAKLLIMADDRGQAALGSLGPDFDFYDVDVDDSAQLQAAAQAAVALREAVNDLADHGQAALANRLKKALGRELTLAELDGLAGKLSPDATAAYRDKWFGTTSGGEGMEPIDRNAASQRVTGGGWLRDDQTLSLRYRPVGHADPWMRAWLDLLAEGASGPQAKLVEPLLRAAMKPTAPGLCGQCHSLDRVGGRWTIQWRPLEVSAEPRGLTRFNHAPHVSSMLATECVSCHRAAVGAEPMASYVQENPRRFVSGFEPMSKAACAACHTPAAAGVSCTQCHRYHGDKSGTWLEAN